MKKCEGIQISNFCIPTWLIFEMLFLVPVCVLLICQQYPAELNAQLKDEEAIQTGFEAGYNGNLTNYETCNRYLTTITEYGKTGNEKYNRNEFLFCEGYVKGYTQKQIEMLSQNNTETF
ncbi:hypothetical protein FTO70_08735 [Methanosarcina sp. KYL-1]|uniref:hypothetical protein n=1 Tax=Methanosarcina sp. KYL-1 TaxID=2602068 RepID=UPI0021017B8E|nr:hypothetical protein [Methanosarcina sp. KYL-1]MCQ1535761.1 hypothetical protein [Methanosarcina sp. KYL-1]